MGIRIQSILRLGMCRAFRFTHAINDQWLINLLASIHNCKWLPLLDQSWAKFLHGVIAFKGQIDGFDDFAFKQWLTDIENPLPTIDSWQLFELIRLYKLINQFNDTSLDSQTVEQFQELIKDLENVLYVGSFAASDRLKQISILYLAIMDYEGRIDRAIHDDLLRDVPEELDRFLDFHKVMQLSQLELDTVPYDIQLKARLYLVLMYEDWTWSDIFTPPQRYAYLKEISESSLADPKDVLMAKLYMVILHEKYPLLLLSAKEQYALVKEVSESQLLKEAYITEALRLKEEIEKNL